MALEPCLALAAVAASSITSPPQPPAAPIVLAEYPWGVLRLARHQVPALIAGILSMAFMGFAGLFTEA